MYVSSGYLKADDGNRYSFFWNKHKFPDYGSYLQKLHDVGAAFFECGALRAGIPSDQGQRADFRDGAVVGDSVDLFLLKVWAVFGGIGENRRQLTDGTIRKRFPLKIRDISCPGNCCGDG